MRPDSEILKEIGGMIRNARLNAKLTQEQVAERAGISRPRYREIEKGAAAARATTLTNVARALGLEMILVPQALLPAITSLMHPHDEDDLPAFAPIADDGL